MSASSPVRGALPPQTAPVYESCASSAPLRTSTSMPVTALMVFTASSVLTMLRSGAVPNTLTPSAPRFSASSRNEQSTRQAKSMPPSPSSPFFIYPARPAVTFLFISGLKSPPEQL